MIFISKAHAQAVEIGSDIAVNAPTAPGAGEAFAMNMVMVLILVALFYLLMIRPQQKRFKEHSAMLAALKKGDKIVTSGGLVGTIEKIKDGEDEVTVDLGGDMKVKALRSTLSKRPDPVAAAKK